MTYKDKKRKAGQLVL